MNIFISAEVEDLYTTLISDPVVKRGLDFIKGDQEYTLKEQKEICAIPAPPFKEEKRAQNFLERLKVLGLKDVQMDTEGNVFGFRPGIGNGPKIIVSAHLDTVFPEGTDTVVKEKDGKLYAPGIADDTRGLAELLSVIRAFNETDIETEGDLIFCGTVGEEGLGDLRGVKRLFKDHQDIDGFISIDGVGLASLTYQATGSNRYQVTYKGPGGHSFAAFGLPSANHALGRSIAKIADLKTISNPKTTFTVGMVKGGSSVNAIAEEASMLVDMRSNSEDELLKLEADFLTIVEKAKEEENQRWNSKEISVEIEKVGSRPAGSQLIDSPIVQAAYQAMKVLGIEPKLDEPGSTDANIPISLGVPAIAVGRGGKSGGGHSLNEWFDPTDAFLGPQKHFLTILGLVGMKGVCRPLLKKA